MALLAAVTVAAGKSSSVAASAAGSYTAAAAVLPPLLTAVVGLLPSLGTFVLCVAAAVFLVASLPMLSAMAGAAHRAERVLAVVEKELPDTVAAMRLSGLEVADCIQELGALGGELTRGVKSTAQLATMAEQGVRLGAAAADATLQHKVKPALAKTERVTRGGNMCSVAGWCCRGRVLPRNPTPHPTPTLCARACQSGGVCACPGARSSSRCMVVCNGSMHL